MDGFLAGVEQRAFRIAAFALGNPDDAMDVVQEAMLALCRRYAARDPAEWRPLFYRILQNGIRDHQRRRTVRERFRDWLRPRGDPDEAPDAMQSIADPRCTDPGEQLAQANAIAELEAALRQLPLRQQQVFLLRIWEGLDVRQTATAMGCSTGSVKTHLSRALQSLRTQLDGYV